MVSLSEIFLQDTSSVKVEKKSSNSSSTTSTSTTKETPEKKKKAEKDPNAPKRNLSSYMLYSQAVRNDTVKQHPNMKAVDVAKLIGEKWNNLSEKEKAPYVKQAEKEKARFDKETLQYKATLNGEHESTPTKRKAVDPSATSAPAASVSTSGESKKKSKKNKEEKEGKEKDSKKKKADKKSSK